MATCDVATGGHMPRKPGINIVPFDEIGPITGSEPVTALLVADGADLHRALTYAAENLRNRHQWIADNDPDEIIVVARSDAPLNAAPSLRKALTQARKAGVGLMLLEGAFWQGDSHAQTNDLLRELGLGDPSASFRDPGSLANEDELIRDWGRVPAWGLEGGAYDEWLNRLGLDGGEEDGD